MRDLLSKLCAALDNHMDLHRNWPAVAASITVSLVTAAFIAVNWGRM
jgi:hypothetical protein